LGALRWRRVAVGEAVGDCDAISVRVIGDYVVKSDYLFGVMITANEDGHGRRVEAAWTHSDIVVNN